MAVSFKSDFNPAISIKQCLFSKHTASQMLVSQLGDFTPTRRTLQETFLYHARIVHFFHRTRVFAESRGNGGQTNRPTIALIDNGRKNLVVDFIQAIAVDVQSFEGIASNLHINATVAFHLGKVADTTKQGIGDTRRSSA